MNKLLRLSISGAVGIIITAALFVGMLSLLNDNKPPVTTTDANINFSFVQDFKEPQVEPPKIKKPPEQKIVQQPPAAPSLNVETNLDPIINTPITGVKGSQLNINNEMSFPGIGTDGLFSAESSGGIKAAIPPMYPPSALMSKTEGWVQVQITVNEFGSVSAVTVLNAEPARVFNAAAKKAVKKWKFHPKTVDGKAMPYTATQTIEFKIDQ